MELAGLQCDCHGVSTLLSVPYRAMPGRRQGRVHHPWPWAPRCSLQVAVEQPTLLLWQEEDRMEAPSSSWWATEVRPAGSAVALWQPCVPGTSLRFWLSVLCPFHRGKLVLQPKTPGPL